jgi:membrane protease YdiL (CAAX protease family)
MTKSLRPDLRVPIVAIVIIEVAAQIARAFLEVRLLDSGEPKPFAQDLSYLVVPPIMIVLMFPILRQHGAFLLSLLRRQDLTVRLIMMSVLLGLTLRITYWGGLISLVSFGVLRNADPNAVIGPEFWFDCPEPATLALSFLVISFLTPIIEEVTNRGLILPALLHRGRFPAVVISSVLFALTHDSQAITLIFVMGLFLGLQIIKMGTLWAPMITHATYNAMTILDWECLQGKWNPIEATPAITYTGLIALSLAIASFSLSIYLVVRKSTGVRVHPDSRFF